MSKRNDYHRTAWDRYGTLAVTLIGALIVLIMVARAGAEFHALMNQLNGALSGAATTAGQAICGGAR